LHGVLRPQPVGGALQTTLRKMRDPRLALVGR
jgi:hypothetical protein